MDKQLLDILVCPVTKGPLVWDATAAWRTTDCGSEGSRSEFFANQTAPSAIRTWVSHIRAVCQPRGLS